MNFEITEPVGAQVFSDKGVLKEDHQIYRETPAQVLEKEGQFFTTLFLTEHLRGSPSELNIPQLLS